MCRLEGTDLPKLQPGGLMIDDLIGVQALPRALKGERTEISELVKKIHIHCEEVRLPHHEGKYIAGSTSGSFWGCQLNGEAG